MVIVANEPPYSVCIGKLVQSTEYSVPRKILATGYWQLGTALRLPFPAPRREAQEELNIYNSY
jgi:hypothetical protein